MLFVEGGNYLGARGSFGVHEVELSIEWVVLVMVEVQADGVYPFVHHADPVGAGGVGYEEVVVRRALEEGLVWYEPCQVVRRLLGVAKDGVRSQRTQEVDEGDRGAYGVAVWDGGGGKGG